MHSSISFETLKPALIEYMEQLFPRPTYKVGEDPVQRAFDEGQHSVAVWLRYQYERLQEQADVRSRGNPRHPAPTAAATSSPGASGPEGGSWYDSP